MKNLLTATLPALGLLALGGCATSGALTTSTETDGVYYSSKDKTTAITYPVYGGNGSLAATAPAQTQPQPQAPDNVATTDDANPDYQGGQQGTAATSGTDYYSNNYSSGYGGSGFGQPYTGPGVSSYNYTPNSSYAVSPSYYGSPYGYNSAFGYGFSPYSYGFSPFGYGGGYGYSPFGYGGGYGYSPFGYSSGLSIGFGFGYGRFGGFGYPYGYGSPFGYGYGSPYGYGGYGGGYYDAYGSGYSRPVIYANGMRSGTGANPILVGPRGGRGGSVLNGAVSNPNSPNSVIGGQNNNGGRRNTGTYSTGGIAAPNSPAAVGGQPVYNNGMPSRRDGGNAVGQPTYSNPGAAANQAATAPQQGQNGGRRGFFGGFFGNGTAAGNPNAAGSNPGQQTMERRSFGQPQNGSSAGSYSQPQQYSQPQYSQPSRSYSQPSGGFGGGGGGGGFGGGGGGRRGR